MPLVHIDQTKCLGCGSCFYACTVKAISMTEPKGQTGKKASVDLNNCVECGVCTREICPVDAISKVPLSYPRSIRIISDPTIQKLTGLPGRGTEEAKTNDVTGRVKRGEVGVCIDVGRPGVGTHMREVQKIATALASLKIAFEKQNPSTALMQDPSKGLFKAEILNERVLSIILEFKCPLEMLPSVISKLREVEPQLNTVFSLGLVSRFDDSGSIEVMPTLEKLGITCRPNAKINVGLGIPLRTE